nr:site-specific integrase [Arenibacter arenosicollis]
MKLKYSEPKIYTGGVDIHQWSKLSKKAKKAALDKDWYVYFSFRDPETGILKRQTNIKAGANSYKEMRKRIAHLRTIQRNLFLLLEAGFDPYGDNTELEMAFMGNSPSTKTKEGPAPVKTTEPVPLAQPIRPVVPIPSTPDFLKKQPLPTPPTPPAPTPPTPPVTTVPAATPLPPVPTTTEIESEIVTLKEAFELALNTKRNALNDNSYIKYKSRINRFLKWLQDNSLADGPILDIKKKTVILYLNEVLDNSSARNRNNTRTALSSLFQVLENNEIITENFIKKINVLKSTPTRNKTYTPSMEREIDTHLKEKDPLLRLFIQFICFNFLRPIEVCRLKIQDLDLQDGKIYVKAKNSPVKIKIIPEILLK